MDDQGNQMCIGIIKYILDTIAIWPNLINYDVPINLQILMNVTVLTVAMGLVLTCRALTFVPALLAISSAWIGNYVLVQFSTKNISVTAQRHWAWIH